MEDIIMRQTKWTGGYLPENVRKTREAKYEIMGMIHWMRQSLDQIEERVKGTPEVDDELHANLVEEWAGVIHKAENMLDSAMVYGII